MSGGPPIGPLGSVRHSVIILCAVAVAADVLLGLADGPVAAATGLAVLAAAGFCVARYVSGGGAQDSGYRRSVRLLGSRAPALGEWRRMVDKSLGEEGELQFAAVLRPQLQRLFAARLAERHGVLLHRSPLRARNLVGTDLWPLIDPTGGPPRTAPSAQELKALLDRLEAL